MKRNFKPGGRWRMKSNHAIEATVYKTLMSRVRWNTEAWARTDDHHEELNYPFDYDGDSDPRYNDIRINIDEWERI